MRRAVIILAGFVLVIVGGLSVQTASAMEKAYCYECVARDGYMDCMHPVPSGHVSCVPYATACLVGAQCGSALRQLKVTGDGSYLNSMLLDPELAKDAAEDGGQLAVASGTGQEDVRNCLGLVAARVYTPSQSLAIESSTLHIEI